jgi:signal transduction histidine kinase
VKRLTSLHVVIASVSLAAVLALAGFAGSIVRFGWSSDALAPRLEREVRETVHAQAAAVQSLARRVASEGALIDAANGSRERLSDLFERLRVVATQDGARPIAITVYVPATAPRAYRVLAWSDGPGEQNLSNDRLSGPSALFVAPGYAGLRLVAVEPVVVDGAPVAVAVAETVLVSADSRFATSLGAVTVSAHYAGTGDTTTSDGFAVASATGAPLVEVRFDPAALAGHRRAFLHRALAIALLPLPLGLSILVTRWNDRRTRSASARARWLRLLWVSGGTLAVVAGCAGIARLAGLPETVAWAAIAVGLLIIVTQVPTALWWQAGRGRHPAASTTVRFVSEHVAGGLVLAVALEAIARLLDRWMTLAVLDRGPFVLFPFSALHILSTGTVLLIETALAWATAAVLAGLAIRWRLLPAGRRTLAAAACWLLPSLGLLLLPASIGSRAGVVLPAVALVAVACGIAVAWLRRTYQRTTQSARLLLALLAGLVPLVILYPLAAQTATRATRHVIETNYAPATAGHPQELLAELGRAQARVDEMTGLPGLVGGPPSSDSQAAFLVWSQTGLERSRVISDVELYGPDRSLVSRFAFNLPEYVYRSNLQPWQGSSCTWEVFGEVPPFGTEERRMLHAERGVCDEATGQLLGGIVVHVASDDYQALPFISSPSPYTDVVSGNEQGPRLEGVRLAVYGWSSQPLFTSERAAWAVAPDTFERLYRTGVPFWASLSTGDGVYDVHFSQNRAGIYALGVPRVTLVEHATRLAEIAVLVAVFFVAWQALLLLHAALARLPAAPLRQLYREVRTSFYRKLFIAFVAVAVVPVVAAAVAFGGYMTARFRADVEYEAATTAIVARGVFQGLTASGERSAELQAEPSDDVMVWIRQVIGHDVNLFEGSELVITSQRDLFDSGFLPTRTPATVYRAIALERRPFFVADEGTGPFSYVVAAAPVTAWGRDTVLTVPLAPRQREMERDLDTLNRRVLVGAVVVVLFAAGFGASLAGRISDPVARLSHATRQIAAGRLDVRVATDTADELRRLVDDFNSMAATLGAQRAELARANQLKAWNEMARQVAHEIKNPLTPVQLAAEHLQHVHNDRGRPLGAVLDQCMDTVLAQVRLLRQIASEFANFAGEPTSRPTAIDPAEILRTIVEPYRVGLRTRVRFDLRIDPDLPPILADRTLLSRALTNLVENAVQAMPDGGSLTVTGRSEGGTVVLELVDTGVGMDASAVEHAFEPYFSTKTGGSGLGLANARRNIEREGGTVTLASAPGQGATVTVTLPAAPAPRPTDDSASAPSR